MFTFKQKTLKEDAKYVNDIVEKYANNSAIKKLISPISNEYFLIDDKNEIYICISDYGVTISNHKFLYKKTFSLSFTDKLKKQVKVQLEQEMQDLKKSLFKNETELLSNILSLPTKKGKQLVLTPNFKTNKKVG